MTELVSCNARIVLVLHLPLAWPRRNEEASTQLVNCDALIALVLYLQFARPSRKLDSAFHSSALAARPAPSSASWRTPLAGFDRLRCAHRPRTSSPACSASPRDPGSLSVAMRSSSSWLVSSLIAEDHVRRRPSSTSVPMRSSPAGFICSLIGKLADWLILPA